MNKTVILDFLQRQHGLQITEDDILFVLNNPTNFHGHARRDQEAQWIIPYMKQQFWVQQIMPNVMVSEIGDDKMGITSIDKLLWYRDHIMEISGNNESFLPIFSFYLNPTLSVSDIRKAKNEGLIGNVKFYPKGGTTNSENGLAELESVRKQLECMSDLGVVFSIHGETPEYQSGACIHRDKREPAFYQSTGEHLMKWYTGPVVAEHISTRTGCEFVASYDNVFATITPHHMLFTNDVIFHKARIKDDFYEIESKMALYPSMVCMPVLKPEEDLNAVRRLLYSQYKKKVNKVFLGDDTAFHTPDRKYIEGCACGVFTSPISLEMYFMQFLAFDKTEPGFLSEFQRFASDIGLGVYGIKPKKIYKRIAIVREPNFVKENYYGAVTPFAGQTLPWKAIDVTLAG
ncbi:MAG TPA: hypothetical protein PKZ56_00075 [Candidatus Paceibacterota bacterium]|nr:hypothetical protein [Candidatus Paceibacterota bacterium]